MQSCWNLTPENRPTFAKLRKDFEQQIRDGLQDGEQYVAMLNDEDEELQTEYQQQLNKYQRQQETTVNDQVPAGGACAQLPETVLSLVWPRQNKHEFRQTSFWRLLSLGALSQLSSDALVVFYRKSKQPKMDLVFKPWRKNLPVQAELSCAWGMRAVVPLQL